MRVRALSVAMLVAASPAAARAECKPTAVAAGDPQLVQSLVSRLTASGIATTSTQGCPAMQVHLELRGQQVHLEMTDAFQRRGERDVRDVATAAAIIESWSLQETETGSLPPPSADVVTTFAPPAPPHLVRSGIAAGFQSSLASNRTTWIGGSLAGCLRVGPLCAGAVLRATKDTRATGDTTMLVETSFSLDALAMADLPRRLGSFILSPGILAGYARANVTDQHHDAMGLPFDLSRLDHQLRVGAHVALLRSLGDHLAVFGELSADGALVRADATAGPRASLRFSLGVRLEAP